MDHRIKTTRVTRVYASPGVSVTGPKEPTMDHRIKTTRVTRVLVDTTDRVLGSEATVQIMDLTCTCGHVSTGTPEEARRDRAEHLSNA